ncbi:50S ribosomal protein L32 [Mycoplasmopsis gallinacea]|uniref:Large ribosomal subunit protein bL32 n=1 Tax=Mycoplasmopsis gallinacea TaxID=29556 RepID=A0A6H0V2H3_9BACT|nr:50S ribosomal protein L32 [Mycoplasmopsis gallinacea]QIW62178.1 50S ribosomal protein L32 [Mycoplasmopsis gallinacea]
MAIVPKRKTSKQRKHKRNSHSALTMPNLVACPNCTMMKEQHVVCRECGFYKGQKVAGFVSNQDRIAK